LSYHAGGATTFQQATIFLTVNLILNDIKLFVLYSEL
jgi:hypothetical protein